MAVVSIDLPPGLERAWMSAQELDALRGDTSYAFSTVSEPVLALYLTFQPLQQYPPLAICDIAPPQNIKGATSEESVVSTDVPVRRWGDVLVEARARLRALAEQMVVTQI